jgi:tetratricopeptide (TPR) repeat protein
MLRNALLPLGEESRIFECLREAERIAKRRDDRGQHARILSYLCRHKLRVNEYAEALDAGARALEMGTTAGDDDVRVAAHLYVGFVHQFLGDLPKAIDHLRNTLRLVERRELERCGLPYLPSVFARMWLAWCVSEQGEFAEGFARAGEAIEVAERIDQPWDRLVAYHGMGLVHLGRGDHPDALHLLERAARLCESVDVVGMHANMSGYFGHALAMTGEPAEGARLLEHAVAVSGPPQSWAQSLLLGFLAHALTLLDRPDEALAAANRALQVARERAEKGYEAWALHALAEVHGATRAPEASRYYKDALRLAGSLGMRPLVAHCHYALGALHRQAGKRRDALRHATLAASLYGQGSQLGRTIDERSITISPLQARCTSSSRQRLRTCPSPANSAPSVVRSRPYAPPLLRNAEGATRSPASR